MIVKRVTDALRRQDWAVVTIEFVLVVVGVLFAFQINEWANGREATKERKLATERLLGEAEATVAFMRLGVTSQKELVDDLQYALMHIEGATWRSADQARMTEGLFRVNYAVPLSPPSSEFDDLVSSGGLGKLGDAHLRSTIARYRATLSFSQRHTDYMRDELPDLEDYEAFHYFYTPDGARMFGLKVDYVALHNDRLLREKLAILAGWHRTVLTMRKRLLKNAARMCIELGRFVDRQCNLNLPPPNFD